MTTISFQPYITGITSEDNRIGSIDPRLSRTNYFDGQLLKASDLTRDQIYLDERLLELGQVLGSGIAQGLEVSLLQNHLLQVTPGIAIAPSGRVLQLSNRTLQINLQDSAFISSLNQGLYRRFNRGLYAIALRYAETVDGVSEAYPADLASRRRMQVSAYAEGVELALIPLNITLPRGDELTIRAALAQQLITQDGRFPLPSDEAVALGLIAIENARPLWLDMGLLRRPLRNPNTPDALQQDLATHYRELFDDVIAARHKSGRNDDFAASNYFRVLPPFGPIAKGAIDPVQGRQSYFPKDYEVSIAPVRQADLASILAESAHLAPLDLSRDADADIMVLVPMSDQAFALRARQLEKIAPPSVNKLPYFNSLALRLFSFAPAHQIDTDANVWQAIWQEAEQVLYVRRPPRTAETNVSAVVLARGFDLPALGTPLPNNPADLEIQLDKALEDYANANDALQKQQQQVKVLQAKIKQLEATLGSDVQLQDALSTIQKLKIELAAAKQSLAELQANAQDANIFKTALQAATDKINQLNAALEAANKKILELSASSNSDSVLQEQVQQLNEALEKAQAQITLLTSQRDQLQLQLAETELNLKKLLAELEILKQKLADVSNTGDVSNTDLSAAKAEIAKLNEQIIQLSEQRGALQTELSNTQQALASAEANSKDATLKLSDALTQLQAVQADLSARNTELGKAKETLSTLQNQVAELKKQLADRPALNDVFSLVELAKMRASASSAVEKLDSIIDNSERAAVVQLLTITPQNYDSVLWLSLLSVAANKNLPLLRDVVVKAVLQEMPVATAYLENGGDLGMTGRDLEGWKGLVG